MPRKVREEPLPTGWQATQRPRKQQGLPEPPAWPLSNWFDGPPEEEVEEE